MGYFEKTLTFNFIDDIWYSYNADGEFIKIKGLEDLCNET